MADGSCALGGESGPLGTETRRANTYEFDGVSWNEVSTATSPSARINHSMAYDAKRGVIVLYGGDDGTNTSEETELWEYNGTTWTQKVFAGDGGGRPSLLQPATAYDPKGERIAFYFGNSEMWFWNGTQFTKYAGAMPVAQSFATSPPSLLTNRIGAVLVDDGRGRLMLYGGQDKSFSHSSASLLSGQLQWFFSGQTWSEPQFAPAVLAAASAQQYDRGTVVRFGGLADVNSDTPNADMWELPSAGWKRTTSSGPPWLAYAAMTHDTARDQLVMFGGGTDGGVLSDQLWLRSGGGTTWTQQPKTSTWPAPRSFHALTYDAARGQTVLFGGFDTDEIRDTWLWNGLSWTQHPMTAADPPAIFAPTMGYDWANDVVILFGTPSANESPKTWMWDGAWHDITNALLDTPPLMPTGTLTWHAARKSLLLSQSFTFSVQPIDVWELHLTSVSPPAGRWQRVSLPENPLNRALGMAFSTLDGSGMSIMFGKLGRPGRVDRAVGAALGRCRWQRGLRHPVGRRSQRPRRLRLERHRRRSRLLVRVRTRVSSRDELSRGTSSLWRRGLRPRRDLPELPRRLQHLVHLRLRRLRLRCRGELSRRLSVVPDAARWPTCCCGSS